VRSCRAPTGSDQSQADNRGVYCLHSIGDFMVQGSVRGGGLGSSTIFKNLMSPTPRRKWYLTTGRRAH